MRCGNRLAGHSRIGQAGGLSAALPIDHLDNAVSTGHLGGTAAAVSPEACGASVIGTASPACSGDGTVAVVTFCSPFGDGCAVVFFLLRRRRVPPFSPGGVVLFLSSCILYATLLFPSSLATQVQPFSLRLFIIQGGATYSDSRYCKPLLPKIALSGSTDLLPIRNS